MVDRLLKQKQGKRQQKQQLTRIKITNDRIYELKLVSLITRLHFFVTIYTDPLMLVDEQTNHVQYVHQMVSYSYKLFWEN